MQRHQAAPADPMNVEEISTPVEEMIFAYHHPAVATVLPRVLRRLPRLTLQFRVLPRAGRSIRYSHLPQFTRGLDSVAGRGGNYILPRLVILPSPNFIAADAREQNRLSRISGKENGPA
jgi:hypothetical protein